MCILRLVFESMLQDGYRNMPTFEKKIAFNDI